MDENTFAVWVGEVLADHVESQLAEGVGEIEEIFPGVSTESFTVHERHNQLVVVLGGQRFTLTVAVSEV